MFGQVYDQSLPQRAQWQDEDHSQTAASWKRTEKVSDANTHIVLHMELHESKEEMANKDHVKELGATAACSLRLTDYWKGKYFMLSIIII